MASATVSGTGPPPSGLSVGMAVTLMMDTAAGQQVIRGTLTHFTMISADGSTGWTATVSDEPPPDKDGWMPKVTWSRS